MQALLDEWRAEAARKPLGMTEAEACQVLEVSVPEGQEIDDEMLKAAYRCFSPMPLPIIPCHCQTLRSNGLVC